MMYLVSSGEPWSRIAITGENPGDLLGIAAPASAHVDGDGDVEAILPSYTAGDDAGAVYVLGAWPSTDETLSSADAEFVLLGSPEDCAGYPIATGNLDSDLPMEILVGAMGADSGGLERGAVCIVWAPFSGSASLDSADTRVERILGEKDSDQLGRGLVAADFDGVGIDDIAASACGYDQGATADVGAVGVFPCPVDADQVFSDGYLLLGEAEGDGAGWVLAAPGDVNRDGHADLLVGAIYNDAGGTDAGVVYLVEGPIERSSALSEAAARLEGDAPGEWAGHDIAGGDVDADGFIDIAVGASQYPGASTRSGRVALFYGPLAGVFPLSEADAVFVGGDDNPQLGTSVAMLDANDDGAADLLLGAPGAAPAGAAFVLYGGGM